MSTPTELARAATIARELNIAVFARLDTHPQAGRQRYRCALYLDPQSARPLDDEEEARRAVARGNGFWFNWDCGPTGPAPEPAQVLNTMAQDAATLENARYDLGAWAEELGLDPDAPETAEMFAAAERQTEGLREVLIDLDTYHRLLWG